MQKNNKTPFREIYLYIFKNLCRNNLFTKSEKKKLAITYKINEPIDIEDY